MSMTTPTVLNACAQHCTSKDEPKTDIQSCCAHQAILPLSLPHMMEKRKIQKKVLMPK
jgi:hypothetical protein